MKAKTGVLLVNLGTPDSPSSPDVRKYLREFLMDERVIDIPFWKRWPLVNLIIAPFRAPKSSKIYRKLWQERGSPLLFYGEDLTVSLQQQLGDDFKVVLGMRYQNPKLESALDKLRGCGKIIIIPMFPQYASASTGSVHQKVMELVSKWTNIPQMVFISNFLEEPEFIEAFAKRARPYMLKQNFDHFVFSYHGIPERQIKAAAVNNYCQINQKCCARYHTSNQYCYRAQCYQTSRLLARSLDIPEQNYTVSFQSRLGKDPWIKPYTDVIIRDFPKSGIKRVLAFSPSFIADCLETTIEVGVEFRDIFLEAGGTHWQLVESLNDSETWVQCLKTMVLEH
ncbi:MAG: ferrochelatase [Cyclobacteriaceae bacterium]|nr:MAG: ferrochelatase [Cyclobacteriaceae bacterium]